MEIDYRGNFTITSVYLHEAVLLYDGGTVMSIIEEQGYRIWSIGDTTLYPDSTVFLETLAQAGYTTFVDNRGSYCGTSGSRSVKILRQQTGSWRLPKLLWEGIYYKRQRWEVLFQVNGIDTVITIMEDFTRMMDTAMAWLKGGWLEAVDYSLRGIVKETPSTSKVLTATEIPAGSTLYSELSKRVPEEQIFFMALAEAGNQTFISHSSGGAALGSGKRCIETTYRGRLPTRMRGFYEKRARRWEVLFHEHNGIMLKITTLDLSSLIPVAQAWLQGGWLAAVEDTLRGFARRET